MTQYFFARCELDTDRRQLKVADIVRDIEPLVFDLLALLLDRGDSVVSREELITCIWKERIVSDSAISVSINSARKAVGDNGKDQAIIKTMPRRGFKVAVPVDRREPDTQKRIHRLSVVEEHSDNTQRYQEDKPVIAVFPFELPVAKGDELYLARGLADEIATELSRFHTLSVISTFSSFQHDPSVVNTESFAKSLGAQFVVTGSFQRNKTALRMTVSLGDIASTTQIWSEKYYFDENEIFDVQDEAVSTIVGSLFSQLYEYQMAAARRKPVSNLRAYECLLRGTNIYKAGDVSLEESRLALYWFDRTLELDPFSAKAMAWRECCKYDFQPNPPYQGHDETAMKNMKLALSIDPGDHEVHRIIGALYLVYRDRELGDYHLAKSAELNPNDARTLLRIGYYRSFLGDRNNDMTYIQRAFDRNPLHPAFYWQNKGVVQFAHQKYLEALKSFRLSNNPIEQTRIYEAACYCALGEHSNATDIVRELRQGNRSISLSWLRTAYPFHCYQGSETLENLLELIAIAGMPE